MDNVIIDQLNRPIRDLRISVTDKCNFRCTYCMPSEIFNNDYMFLSEKEQLSFQEITQIVRIFASLGVKKVRLTGGEPLLRRNLDKLIEKLLLIKNIKDLALTTNGVLLGKYGDKLWNAGLRRLNISLDALDPLLFGEMNGRKFKPHIILENIDYVKRLGFNIKINMVVQKGINEQEIIPMATYFKEKGITLRFIEFMDVGNDNKWSFNRVISKSEIINLLQTKFQLEGLESAYFGEVAQRYKYKDSHSQIGFITSVSHSFCATCTRVRLSSDGKLYTCLFASTGYDLRQLIRSGYSSDELRTEIVNVWKKRTDRYSDERMKNRKLNKKKINMSYIGG